ncbi:MAG: accessory factor UbiK family protein [Alphaproteobacteria bacterium]|nr:accessory factor UbiK family protein [Alphaproteobacteria bacterium]
MQTENRFFDDLARVAGGAFSTMTGLKAEMEAMFRQQLERMMGDMSLVSRDEFEAVREMAAKARAEQEALAVRVAELEAKLAAAAPAGRRKSEKE